MTADDSWAKLAMSTFWWFGGQSLRQREAEGLAEALGAA
jgi:hypothetical protein